MKDLKDTCKLAVVQAAPVMFDKTACIEKTLKLINECTANGAELIVFPELFIPGYPYGMTFGFRVGSRNADGRKDWKVYYDNSILANGPEMQQLIEKAKEQGIYLSIGYSERDAVTGTLYNSNMMIAPDGTAMNHRKLKPTGSERVVWGDADRDYFPVMETPWGPMGNLICWESYMPLARVALYQKGISLYISPNTNDNPEWQDTIRHIAIEGHCYFINCDMFFTRADYPKTASAGEEIAKLPAIHVEGLMTIAPYVEDPEENRPVFRKLKELSVDIAAKNINNVRMAILSMGMTGDYEVAVEEGATLVRVGTGVFGERDYSKR